MDLDAYVAERRGEWNRLETLARRRKLSPDEADELVLLYQRAATHLSVIRSRSPDPVLVAGLSRLVLTARAAVTGSRKFSWQPVARFFTTSLPGELYRTRRWWLTVGLICIVAGGAMMRYVAANPGIAAMFLSPGEIDSLVNQDFVGYYSEYAASRFAAQVWTNNALLTAQCLASGVLILPVFYLLGSNILSIGLVGGVMIGQGAGGTLFAYLTPHGLLELTCVFVGAGVGLRIGWSWIAPGPHRTRRAALATRARSGMLVALGLVLALLVAGLVEAYVTPSALPAFARIGIGAVVWLLFLAYALVVGRAADRRARSADIEDTTAVPTR